MPKTLEEEYEEALKGYDHPSLNELCERDPALRALVFSAGLYERLLARLYPEPAAEEKEETAVQPPTA